MKSVEHRAFWVLFCLAVVALPARAGELNPYALPSQQAMPRIEQRAPTPTISEAFYQDYALQVRRLDPAQRRELLTSIENSFLQAYRAGRMEEANHYQRLIQIVQKAL